MSCKWQWRTVIFSSLPEGGGMPSHQGTNIRGIKMNATKGVGDKVI
jgi:hypothetical protein